jgi:[ribosomal protein S5]-alanine N-acetyltransferase
MRCCLLPGFGGTFARPTRVEKTPYRACGKQVIPVVAATTGSTVDPGDWRTALPALTGSLVTLREVEAADAPVLHSLLATEGVSRLVSPLSATVEVFERFVEWAHRQRAAGDGACFSVVPRNADHAVGLFQVRSLEPGFATAEWGFALTVDYWGTGMFVDAARLTLDFVFAAIGAHRLEARAALENGRGNAALRKMGSVRECVLRGSFLRYGDYIDQYLWSILIDDWRESIAVPRRRPVVH